ncbi:MAG: ATP-binding protein, partial [Ignavibacteria bacterium]|nr:ATP-binding protein [Ignavibacteria bacterium]
AKNKLSEYADILLLAKQDAEQGSRLKSQFLANMSHEIRTPMNSVIGFSDILSNLITDKQQLAYLDSIRSSGRSLLVLIDDILDLSKIESGKLQIEKNPLDMRNLISEITKVFKLQSEQKQIEFEIQIDNDFPKTIFMSEMSMRQILFNLIGNAFKFTHNGIITVNLSAQKINDELLNVNLSIQDTGIGVAQQDQEHIFEAFYQANTDRTMYKGTGLGLAITKRLVEAMGGTIAFSSIFGKGTTFSILFSSVKAVPQRTSLHLVTTDTNSSSDGAEFALISDDIKIQAAVDSVMLEIDKMCDVYEDVETYLFKAKTQPYMALFWDVKQISEFSSIQLLDSSKNGLQDQTNILLLQQINQLEIIVPDWIKCVFRVSNESKQLTHFVDQMFIDTTDKPDISLDEMDSSNKIDKNIQQLTALFKKAQQSQFINDAENFADALVLYSIRNENSKLLQLGQKLKTDVQSFDIEQIDVRLKEFQSYLNTLQIEL